MNLVQLKAAVDAALSHPYRGHDDDVSVVVTLAEPSVGPRASASIETAYMGFDWEHGQFRLHPDKDLVRKGRAQDDVLEPHEYLADGVQVRQCRACGCKVHKKDAYCAHCGQRLK